MPSDADADADALEAFTGQPGLFTGLDCDLPTVSGARSFFHSGKTTSQHEQEAARIVAAATLGWSVRKIARDLGHSRNTVAAVLRLAESAGKVEPVARRVLAAAAAAVHSDIEAGNALIEQAETPQEVSAAAALRRSTWVGVGILADKAVGQGAGVVVNVGPGSVVQVVQDYARQLREIAGTDALSTGPVRLCGPDHATSLIDAGGVVVDGPAGPVIEQPAQEGGEGVRSAVGGGNNDGTT